jgi:hypothetical protein
LFEPIKLLRVMQNFCPKKFARTHQVLYTYVFSITYIYIVSFCLSAQVKKLKVSFSLWMTTFFRISASNKDSGIRTNLHTSRKVSLKKRRGVAKPIFSQFRGEYLAKKGRKPQCS